MERARRVEESQRSVFFRRDFCGIAISRCDDRNLAASVSEDERFESDRLGSRRSGLTSEVPRTLVMSVRYALRISVDDATEETPSAAYRSGSPEAVESGAAGIVAEAVLDERSRQKARGMCRRRASGRGYGGRIRGRTFRTEGRVAGVVAVVRDARRRVRRVRRSDTTRRVTRRDDGKTPPRKTQGRKRGGEPAKRLDPIAPIGKEPTRFTGFLGQRVPVRDSFSRCCVAPRATKSVQAENPKLLRERAPLRGDQRARADPHHGVPRSHR